VDGAFEGDLIRPLGLVTLYFGYAEAEVDALLDALSDVRRTGDLPRNAPLGHKLAAVRDLLTRLKIVEASELVSIIDDARNLVDLRNTLVHSCILAQGRVVPSDKSQRELNVTPKQLVELAKAIFTWKELLNSARQLRLMPALKTSSHDHGT